MKECAEMDKWKDIGCLLVQETRVIAKDPTIQFQTIFRGNRRPSILLTQLGSRFDSISGVIRGRNHCYFGYHCPVLSIFKGFHYRGCTAQVVGQGHTAAAVGIYNVDVPANLHKCFPLRFEIDAPRDIFDLALLFESLDYTVELFLFKTGFLF